MASVPLKEEALVKAKKDREDADRLHAKVGVTVNGRFKVHLRISSGSSGAVFAAVDTTTGARVAVKFEDIDNRSVVGNKARRQLINEFDVYEVMQRHSGEGIGGVPRMIWCGQQYEHNIIVMDLLGPSLEQLFTFCNYNFSAATVYTLGRHMVDRVRRLHDFGFIHRDIKPANFAIGLAESDANVYLIDFGLARRYTIANGGVWQHVPFAQSASAAGEHVVGTAAFASLNAHHGRKLSRRDDLESVAYIIIELLCKALPWKEERGGSACKRDRHNRMKGIKERESVLQELRSKWPEVAQFLLFCRGLRYDQKPDYDFLSSLLSKAALRLTGDELPTAEFEWVVLKQNPHTRFKYECSFKWTLPVDEQPHLPPPIPAELSFGHIPL